MGLLPPPSPTARTSRSVPTTSRTAGTIPASNAGRPIEDLYRIFMTGVDGTPMPSFADVIQPNDAWDLVHFLRTLQTHRHSKENEVSKGPG